MNRFSVMMTPDWSQATAAIREVIPLLVVFCCHIVPVSDEIPFITGMRRCGAGNMLAILLWCCVYMLYAVVFIQFGIKYYQFKKKRRVRL